MPINMLAEIDGNSILIQIVNLLTGGLIEMAKGIGQGLQALVSRLFLNEAGNGLSTFGVVAVVFGGIALAIGLSRFVLRWVSTFGK